MSSKIQAETLEERADKCARGSWQHDAVYYMLHDGFRPLLRGRARQYAGKYRYSLDQLLLRLILADIAVELTPGPKGGTSFGIASYKITGELGE